mgnify:FL=1
MKLVAGIDIGNATTETALARIEDGHAVFLASGTVPTTGIKGTRQNINGIFHSLTNALEKAGLELKELSEVRLNEAAPVIGDVAMETITETIITESTMIGTTPPHPAEWAWAWERRFSSRSWNRLRSGGTILQWCPGRWTLRWRPADQPGHRRGPQGHRSHCPAG